MVRGLDTFRDYFSQYADRYVLIGGTASTLAMEDAGLAFRATRDLDIVLVAEALDAAFGTQMWAFVRDGGYEIRQGSTGHPRLYRFQKPQDAAFPHMIELFSRQPGELALSREASLTPLPMGDAVSSLSAILMDEDYYAFVLSGRRTHDGLTWVDADRLIPLKASAWLDLTARVAAGERIDANTIKKHLRDVFRLSQLLAETMPVALPGRVARQLSEFLAQAPLHTVDLKLIGVSGDLVQVVDRLRRVYGLAVHPVAP